MRLLLDTHALLWWMSDPESLSPAARAAITDGSNSVFVSAVTAWEIVVKTALGKLDAPEDLAAALRKNRFTEMPITLEHSLAIRYLPPIHRDPFDRMLIAQALCEQTHLVTRDESMRSYPVPIVVA